MNKFNCLCHESPCICESSPCQTEIIDKNGIKHHIESVYKKISLKALENKKEKIEKQYIITNLPQISKSVKQNSREGTILNEDLPENNGNCNDCSECCEHICTKDLSNNNNLTQKRYNISAELYCVMKMQNTELGQIASKCPKLSSDEDVNGEESSDYDTAPGKSDDDEEEYTFSTESAPHSKEERTYSVPTSTDSHKQNETRWKTIRAENKIQFRGHNRKNKIRQIEDEQNTIYKTLPNSHNIIELYKVNIPEEKKMIIIHSEGNGQISENKSENQDQYIEDDGNTLYRSLPNSHNTIELPKEIMPDDKFNKKRQLTEYKKKKHFQQTEDEKKTMFKSTPSSNSKTELRKVSIPDKKKWKSHDLLTTRDDFRDFKKRNPLSLIELTSKSQKKKHIIVPNFVPGNQLNATNSPVISDTRMGSFKSEQIETNPTLIDYVLQEQVNRHGWVPGTPYEESIAYICTNFQKSPPMKRLEELKTNLRQENDILLTDMINRQNLQNSKPSVTLLNKSRATRIPVKTKKKYEYVPKSTLDEINELRNAADPNVKLDQQTISKVTASSNKIGKNKRNSSKFEDRTKQLMTSYRRSHRRKISKKQIENRLLQGSKNMHLEPLSLNPDINIRPKIKYKKFIKNCEQITHNKNISQTEVHICIKESSSHLSTNRCKSGADSKNVLQTVNIEVTPKNSESVRINVMPTIPEINKDGIITIPVQFKIIHEEEVKEEQEEKEPIVSKVKTKNKLLYQENHENHWCENYMVRFKRDVIGEIRPLTSPEECANMLWTQLKQNLVDPYFENKPVPQYDHIEVQTDLALGPKLLSKSLNSFASDTSVSSVRNKSEPVAKYGIQLNDITLPQPNSFAIRNVPSRKSKRRFPNDNTKVKENSPTTLGGIPPSEEIKARNETDSVNKKCLCNRHMKQDQQQQEEPSLSGGEVPTEKEVKQVRSKIISLVFSESFYDKEQQTLKPNFVQEEKHIDTTPKVDIQWPNILLPIIPQIKKINISPETSTTITDLSTDENNSTINTCSNLPEDAIQSDKFKKISIDKQTNTFLNNESSKKVPNVIEEEILWNITKEPSTTNKMTEMLKAFKEDPVLAAFKAFEEELKPVRKALTEVQMKLRALNLPELQYIFRKDENLDFTDISRSNSQIGSYTKPHDSSWTNDMNRPLPYIRGPLSCDRRSSYCSRRPSSSMRRRPSDSFEHPNKILCNVKVCHCKTPTPPVNPRPISTDLWSTFGSCERNTVKGPYDKRCQYDMQTPQICNYRQRCSSGASSTRTNYRNIPFDLSENGNYNNSQNYDSSYFSNNLEEAIEIENLEYTPSYQNITACPHLYSQQHCYYDLSRNSSGSSLHTAISENFNPNYLLTRKCSSRYVAIQRDTNNKYFPVKLRPVSNYYKYDNASNHPNSAYSTRKNTTVEFKNGVTHTKNKIDLSKCAHKHGTGSKQKYDKKNYPLDDHRNSCYTHLENNDYQNNKSPTNYDWSQPCVKNYNIRSQFYDDYLGN